MEPEHQGPQGKTELLRLERALAKAAWEREQLLATVEMVRRAVNHDLRSPLQAFASSAELLLDVHTVEERRQLAALQTAASNRLAQMLAGVQDMLAQAGGPLVWRETPLDALLAEVGASAPPSLRIEAAPGARVPGDRQRILWLLEPLLDNARLHGAPPTTLSVQAEGAVRVTVRDAGAGFHPAHADALCRTFFAQGPRAGLGLGLARARCAAHALGGTLTAALAPDGGARFTATWPTTPPWTIARPEE